MYLGAYVYFGVRAIGVQLIIWGFTPPNKWNWPQFKCSYAKVLSCTEILAKCPRLSIKWCLVHIIYTFSLLSPTALNSVLPCRTQKHTSFSAGIPTMQVHLHLNHLPGTLYAPCESSSSTPCAEGSLLTCGKGFTVAC